MKTKLENFKLSNYKYLCNTSWANPRILVGTQEVKIIDEHCGENNYPILCNNGEKYSVNGKHQGKGQNLVIYYNKKCPIVDGRLVESYTFAVRLKNFLKGITVSDPCSEEELEMLTTVADDLLDWQISTVTDQEEIDYLKRLGLM